MYLVADERKRKDKCLFLSFFDFLIHGRPQKRASQVINNNTSTMYILFIESWAKVGMETQK